MAQLLAVLMVNLDLLAQRGPQDRHRRMLAESRAIAEQCSREVRTMAYVLYPPLLVDVGLVLAVKSHVAGFVERSGVQVELDIGAVDRLPEPIEIALFRVVQESLTNIRRHASSATASIHLARTADGIVLDIRDQGQGLRDSLRRTRDASELERLGVGIRGMRERNFTDTGTTVHVCVPVHTSTP
jgi:signal transduction histidine kinase